MQKSKLFSFIWFGFMLCFHACEVDDDMIDPCSINTFRYFDASSGLSSNYIMAMIMDNSNDIYVGTMGGGICIYADDSWTSIRQNDGLIDDIVYSLSFDKNRNLWAGTESGISIISRQGQVIANIDNINGHAFRALKLFGDSWGGMWILTDTILYLYTIDDQGLYQRDFEGSIFSSITEDSRGIIWFAHADGAYFFDYETGFDLFEVKFNDLYYGVGAIMEDHKKNKWFGILDMEKSLDKALRIRSSEERFINLYNADVCSIVEDHNHNIWFTTVISGVVRYDGVEPKSFGLKDGLTDLGVLCSLVDSRGNVWFGTFGEGICIYIQN